MDKQSANLTTTELSDAELDCATGGFHWEFWSATAQAERSTDPAYQATLYVTTYSKN